MVEVVASVFDLMGKTADPQMEELLIHQRVDDMFQVMYYMYSTKRPFENSYFTGYGSERRRISVFRRVYGGMPGR